MLRAPAVQRVVTAIVLLALGGGGAVLLSEHKRLRVQLSQSEALCHKMRQETSRLETENAHMAQEYETLKQDVLSYMALNTTLHEETEQLQARLAEAHTRLADKDQERDRSHDAHQKALKELKQQLASLEMTRQRERAVFQYNLGVVYAQAQRYEEAIGAYTKAVELDPKNPEAHYNLALIYEQAKGLPAQAAWHYRRYLELNPQAEDRDEVARRLERLTATAPQADEQPAR